MPIAITIPPDVPYPTLDRDLWTGRIGCDREDLAPVFEANPGLEEIILANEEAFVAFLLHWYVQARAGGQQSLVMEQVLAEAEAGDTTTPVQVQAAPARLQ